MNVFSFNINPRINPIFLYIQLIEDRPIFYIINLNIIQIYYFQIYKAMDVQLSAIRIYKKMILLIFTKL